MARIAKSFPSWLGTAENFDGESRSSGDPEVQSYHCAIGRWSGGTTEHRKSSSAGTCILEHSAKVITRP